MSRGSRLIALTAAIALLAACSSSSSSSTTIAGTLPAATTSATAAATTAPTTTLAATTTLSPADEAMAYTAAGPHPVGVTTLHLAKGPAVEVWYPAVDGTTGTDSYDVRDYTPPAIKALLTGNAPAVYSYTAGRDAAFAEGTFPVVLFSHGFTGIRVQSTFLTAHLASWGMVVVSPEHPSRDLTNVLGGTAKGGLPDSVDDLLMSLELVTTLNGDANSPLHDHLDLDHVAAVGHSAGGGTVLGAASDPRIDGYVSLASGRLDKATTAMPNKPSFFIGGAVDGVVPFDTVTAKAFADAPAPSRLWRIDGVGHNGFDDFCTFGNGKGIIGVAEASGLGPLLAAQPQLKKLGEDGCIPPAVDVNTTFPVIRHAVTSWLRALFGIDATAIGLDTVPSGVYPQAVATKSK